MKGALENINSVKLSGIIYFKVNPSHSGYVF